jgi:hypothetical protein
MFEQIFWLQAVESRTLCAYRHKGRNICPVSLGIQSCFAMVQTDWLSLGSYASWTYFTFSADIHSLPMLVQFRISLKVSIYLEMLIFIGRSLLYNVYSNYTELDLLIFSQNIYCAFLEDNTCPAERNRD